jgi:prevent-host-death family protein
MRTTAITELKASLSETLARVKAGEEVLVTEHGRPIAKIVPLPSEVPEAAIEELVRAGGLRLPTKPLDVEEFLRQLRPEVPVEGGDLLLEAFLEERRNGR